MQPEGRVAQPIADPWPGVGPLHHPGLMSMGGHRPTRSHQQSQSEQARRAIIENHAAIERCELGAQTGSPSPWQSAKCHRDARAILGPVRRGSRRAPGSDRSNRPDHHRQEAGWGDGGRRAGTFLRMGTRLAIRTAAVEVAGS